MESASLSLLNPCYSFLHHRTTNTNLLQIQCSPLPQVSRRIVPTFPQEPDCFINPSQSRTGLLIGSYYRNNFDVEEEEEDDDDDDDDDDAEDRSLDLLLRFLETLFNKVSKKARKAVRSVLPLNISAKLVRFSVNGSLILTFLWVLKAFLQVVCTLGTVMFISILVIRGVWTGISALQENRYYRRDGIDDLAWSGTRPAA